MPQLFSALRVLSRHTVMKSALAEYRVQSNLETEDYLKGLENLRKAW